jgi:hypothetical protein
MRPVFGTDRLCPVCGGDGRPNLYLLGVGARKARERERAQELARHKRAGTEAPAPTCYACGGTGLEPK